MSIFEDVMDQADQLMQQQQESEAELYYAILDALQTAKNLGLNDDHLKTLCYATGINFEALDN